MKNKIPITDLQHQTELKRLDELELLEIVTISCQEKTDGKTISHDEIKKRLNYSLNSKRVTQPKPR